MEQPTHASVDERLRLLAEELSAQRGSADAHDIDERMAYLEEAMASSRLTRPLTSRAGGGMQG